MSSRVSGDDGETYFASFILNTRVNFTNPESIAQLLIMGKRPPLQRHGRARPGHPRFPRGKLFLRWREDVDRNQHDIVLPNDLAESDRLPVWQEQFGRAVVRAEIEPLSDGPFHARATIRALSGLRIIAWRGSAVCNRQTPALAADGDESIGLFMNLGAKACVSQRGREIVLSRGDAAFDRDDGDFLYGACQRIAIAARFRSAQRR
jgi:hypothetical protein